MKPDKQDLMGFFDGKPGALDLYLAFEKVLYVRFPQTRARVQKTQISFSNRYVFACISFLRVKKKALLPDPYIVLTLGLPCPLASPRVEACTQPYPGRWTAHIVLGSEGELDDELMGLVEAAWNFALIK
ncbi:MAG: DUF5655 domain-containing protein [Bacillota bacterium]|jgi:hypothetical protein|nr:DUF5655 domain-containing protein [Bacillota bacterium]